MGVKRGTGKDYDDIIDDLKQEMRWYMFMYLMDI
jgi:hypothetical protein